MIDIDIKDYTQQNVENHFPYFLIKHWQTSLRLSWCRKRYNVRKPKVSDSLHKKEVHWRLTISCSYERTEINVEKGKVQSQSRSLYKLKDDHGQRLLGLFWILLKLTFLLQNLIFSSLSPAIQSFVSLSSQHLFFFTKLPRSQPSNFNISFGSFIWQMFNICFYFFILTNFQCAIKACCSVTSYSMFYIF